MFIALLNGEPMSVAEGIQQAGKNPALNLEVVEIDRETLISSCRQLLTYQVSCQSSSQHASVQPDMRAVSTHGR